MVLLHIKLLQRTKYTQVTFVVVLKNARGKRKAASDDDDEIELSAAHQEGPLAGGRTRRARRYGGVDSCDLFISRSFWRGLAPLLNINTQPLLGYTGE